GDARFAYSIKPLGANVRPIARFDATVDRMDVAQLTDFEQLPGLRFAGTGAWHNLLEWPLGKFSDHRGDGRVVVTAPVSPPANHLPIAGELAYRYGPDEVAIDTGVFATEHTNVTFQGTTAWGSRSRLRFHVTS